MNVRENLIKDLARKDLVLTVARWEAKEAAQRLSMEEDRIARRASSIAADRWLDAGMPGPGPELIDDDLVAAREVQRG